MLETCEYPTTQQNAAPQADGSAFINDVLHGLACQPKRLSPKYFYDEKGSQYFDEICQLEEYYPYTAELALLPQVTKALRTVLTDNYCVVEFGAGSLKKIQPLFDDISGIQEFMPIDISGDFLRASTAKLSAQYPNIKMTPIEADFTQSVDLPASNAQRLGFFPGSTIGNFTPAEAKRFLQQAKQTLGDNSYLLIGVDTKKSPTTLHQAYNDSQGVTARFNLNLLERINKEAGANFKPDYFSHYAFYNPTKGCIEMHLVSRAQQVVSIAQRQVSFELGESLHTECSYKYNQADFTALAQSAGWQVANHWLAEQGLFSIYLLRGA